METHTLRKELVRGGGAQEKAKEVNISGVEI